MVAQADTIPLWWNSKNAHHLLPATTKRDPAATSVASRTDAPRLILLCTWTDAAPRHIEKYISGYRLLYPSPILLTRTSSADFFTPEKVLMQKGSLRMHSQTEEART
ncbi:hypothetical protein EDB80DRAFT_308134 [Ilyonectria destructans]|nr:hypothetical protein EDB80DRAFT_308134 [Ilyonectria destructans]